MHPKTRKILYSLRLRRIFNGVFVKANERIMEILQLVEPFVTYGYEDNSLLLLFARNNICLMFTEGKGSLIHDYIFILLSNSTLLADDDGMIQLVTITLWLFLTTGSFLFTPLLLLCGIHLV